ncbi:MAG: glycosyltransferase [Planctomycetes bacterium]|nr:glycosyltransferase [Planctomycetota bacterium]
METAVATTFWMLLGTVAFAYAGYPLLLALLALLAKRSPKSADVTPCVTLLIPAYNEERALGAKLESCVALDYPRDRLQVIVLSDGSTDGTNAVAARYADRGIALMAFAQNRGKVAVLRDGLAAAQGEIVAFSDAASRLAPDSLRNLVRPFADPTVGCVSGVYKVLSPDAARLGAEEGFYWRYETFIKQRESGLGSTLGAHGSLYAVRRALCPDLARVSLNDDYEIPVLIAAAGHRVVYAPDAVACEEAREMAGFHRRVRLALGNFRQLRLLGALLRPPRPWLVFSLVAHKLLRLIGPLCLLAALAINLFLPGPLYRATLILQLAFYALAAAGSFLPLTRHASRVTRLGVAPLKLAFYFTMINAAYLVAFLRLLTGAGRIGWRAPASPKEQENRGRGTRTKDEDDGPTVADKVRSHFRATAAEFDAIYSGEKGALGRWLDHLLRWDMYERFRRTVAECSVGGASVPRVLDVGCGSGRFSVAAAKAGAREVLGLDFAPSMLDIARQLAERQGVGGRCRFEAADFMERRFAEPFDITLAIGLFDYVADCAPFLRKMRRVSRLKVVATFPRRWTWRAPVRKLRLALRGCPVFFFTRPQVERLMAGAGFKRFTIERIGKIYFVVGHCGRGEGAA